MDALHDLDAANDFHHLPFQEIYEEIAKTLDRFTRAISRMWTLGPLGSEGQRHMGLIKEFLFLRDEGLGQPR